MAHSVTVEAIVLKTYDVGEADRFCILFTKERGRVAVRAQGVRRLVSRKGGSLIPFQHINVDIREGSAGLSVSAATPKADRPALSLSAFMTASQGFEILIRLVQDEEQLLPVFHASVAFLQACEEEVPHAALAYVFRLLHILGLLPSEDELMLHQPLVQNEREFLSLAREGYFVRSASLDAPLRLERLRDRYLQDQLSSPLKVPGVAAGMQMAKK